MQQFLFDAIKAKDSKSLANLLENPATRVDDRDGNGRSSFFYAMEVESLPCAQLLLNKHADINLRDNEGNSPIFGAIQNGRVDALNFLLQNPKCDANLQNNAGMSPLMKAIDNAWIEGVQILVASPRVDVNGPLFLSEGGMSTPLIYACDKGHSICLQILLSHAQININAQRSQNFNNNNDTALISAAYRNHIECVYLLLNTPGINVKLTNSSGETALQTTAKHAGDNPAYKRTLQLLKDHSN